MDDTQKIPTDTPNSILSAKCQCGHLFTNHIHDRVLGECELATCECAGFVAAHQLDAA